MSVSLTTVTYAWRGGGFHAPAQAIGEELAALEIKPGDYHRTRDLLEAARDPSSPLHDCLPWDDEQAAELHRLNVCRAILRSICVVIVKDKKRYKQNAYYHVRDAEGPRYVRAETVARSRDLRAAALDELLAMLTGLQRRFELIEELEEVLEPLSQTIKAARRVRRKRK